MTGSQAAAESFAALQHIEDGDWDRWLMRLRAAIEQRRATQGYADSFVAGARSISEGSVHVHHAGDNPPRCPVRECEFNQHLPKGTS